MSYPNLHHRYNVLPQMKTIIIKKSNVAGAITLLAMSLTIPVSAGLYRWTDSNGKVHYSDKVPQEIAQKGHVELNDNGTKKKVIISAEERKRIRDQKILEITQAKEQAVKKKQQDLDEMRDIQLLNMFTTPEELIKVYNSKLEMTEESINLLKARHKNQSRKLERLEQQHERSKNAQTKEALAKKIDDMLDSLTVYQQAITENYVEKEKLKKEFGENLARFTELLKMQKQAQK
jgi:hypothetical protein